MLLLFGLASMRWATALMDLFRRTGSRDVFDVLVKLSHDQLLRRVIDSQISGRRIEPEKNEVIRAVGQYDAGRCVLPPDFGKQA